MAEGKGMSKGCLIALIVVGIIVVVVAILGVVGYMYKDDLVNFGVSVSVTQLKEMVAENPPEGVDVEQFNRLADAFVEKFKAGEVDAERFAPLMQKMQGYLSDKKIDADEMRMITREMTEIFPDLSGMLESDADMEMEMDTTGMLEDSPATP